MIRILALLAGPKREFNACDIYRITLPFDELNRSKQWHCEVRWFQELMVIYDEKKLAGILPIINAFDIIVLPRMHFPAHSPEAEPAMATLMSYMRQMGKRIIYEIDDDYTNDHRKVIDGDAIKLASWCDAITVSTPYLGKLMAEKTGRKTYTLPNSVDGALWIGADAPERSPDVADKIIIGLTGSATHLGDWEILKNVMPRVLSENPKAYFVVMGFHPEYLKGLPQTSYLQGTGYEMYARCIKGCDIILCPVDPEDGFNNGKSELKAVEGMSACRTLPSGEFGGAAVIATSNPVYRLAIRNEKTGLVVDHTEEAWYNAITSVVQDAQKRQALQVNGLKWAESHRTIEKQWHKWAQAYTEIIRTKPMKLLPHQLYEVEAK